MPRTEEQFKEIREKMSGSILQSALKLFATKGYKGTSINDIAVDANISKGLIYNYFSSKQEIGESLFSNLLEVLQNMISQIEVEPNPIRRIQMFISLTIDHVMKNEEFWKLYSGFLLQPEAIKLGGFFNAEFLGEVFEKLENTFKEANIKNSRFEALKLGAILDGVPFHYLFMKDKYPIEDMRDYLLKVYSEEGMKDLLINVKG